MADREALIARELRKWAAAEDLTGSMDDCYIAKLRRAADALAARPEGEIALGCTCLDGSCAECGADFIRTESLAPTVTPEESDALFREYAPHMFRSAPTVTPTDDRYNDADVDCPECGGVVACLACNVVYCAAPTVTPPCPTCGGLRPAAAPPQEFWAVYNAALRDAEWYADGEPITVAGVMACLAVFAANEGASPATPTCWTCEGKRVIYELDPDPDARRYNEIPCPDCATPNCEPPCYQCRHPNGPPTGERL